MHVSSSFMSMSTLQVMRAYNAHHRAQFPVIPKPRALAEFRNINSFHIADSGGVGYTPNTLSRIDTMLSSRSLSSRSSYTAPATSALNILA